MADLGAVRNDLETQHFSETDVWAWAELGPWMLWTPTLSLVCQILSERGPAPQA